MKPLADQPWSDSTDIHEGLHTGMNKANTFEMDNFWCAMAMDRMPPNSDPVTPHGPLSLRAWHNFYHDQKQAHPMPVTQWIDEWFSTERDDPYLNLFADLHRGAMKQWAEGETAEIAVMLWRWRSKNIYRYAPIPADDNTLDHIRRHAAGRVLFLPQARLGYWAWQMRQMDLSLEAFEDWPDMYHRHASKAGLRPGEFFTEMKQGEAVLGNGKYNNHALVTIHPERVIEGLVEWQGEVIIHIGCGAVGGMGDMGGILCHLQNNRIPGLRYEGGWQLVAAHRVLYWPRMHEYMYVFKRRDALNDDRHYGSAVSEEAPATDLSELARQLKREGRDDEARGDGRKTEAEGLSSLTKTWEDEEEEKVRGRRRKIREIESYGSILSSPGHDPPMKSWARRFHEERRGPGHEPSELLAEDEREQRAQFASNVPMSQYGGGRRAPRPRPEWEPAEGAPPGASAPRPPPPEAPRIHTPPDPEPGAN